MTVIAAARASGTVWMAADSFGTDDDGRPWPNPRKIIEVPDVGRQPALIGHTGPAAVHHRVRQRLAVDFEAPDVALADDAWAESLALTFGAWAREEPSLDDDGYIDSLWLLAGRGQLWLLRPDYATALGDYNAIGSGGDLALGVLHDRLGAASSVTSEQAREAVVAAVKTALLFDTGCRGEVVTFEHRGQ